MNSQRLTKILAWAGSIPFVFFALVFIYGSWDWLITPGYAMISYAIYAAVILSFLAGSHWGLALSWQGDNRSEPPMPGPLFISSNIIAVLAWVGISMQFKVLGLALVLLGFIVQLFIDYRLRKYSVISDDYFATRFKVTIIVSLTLIAVILHLMKTL